MPAMTDVDLKKLTDAMEKIARGQSRQSFSINSAGNSAYDKVNEMYSSLDDLIKAFGDSSKSMRDKANAMRVAFGGKDNGHAEKEHYDRLEKLSQKTDLASKTIVAFAKKMKSLEGDIEAQQKLNVAIAEYKDSLVHLDEINKAVGNTKKKADIKAINTQLTVINLLEDKLRAFGVEIEEFGKPNPRGVIETDKYIKNLRTVNGLMESNARLISDKSNTVSDAAKIKNTIAATASAAAKSFAKELLGTIPGRLQNLQTDYKFTDAASRGLSSTEFAQFRNENRFAQTLRGPDGDINDGAIRANLRQRGLIGTDAAAQQSKLYGIGMSSGIGTSDSSINGLSDISAKLSILDNTNIGTATDSVKDSLNNPALIAMMVGKSQKDILSVLNEQLTVQGRLAKISGFTSASTFEIMKMNREQKYKGVVDRFKQSIMADLAIKQHNKMVSPDKQLTDQEALRLRVLIASGKDITGADAIELQNLKTKYALGDVDIKNKSAELLAQKNPQIYGAAVPLDVFEAGGGISTMQWSDAANMADLKKRTDGVAAAATDLEKTLRDLNASFSDKENHALRIMELGGGIKNSPIGQGAGAVGSAAWEAAKIAGYGLAAGSGWATATRGIPSAIRGTDFAGIGRTVVNTGISNRMGILKGGVANLAGGLIEYGGDALQGSDDESVRMVGKGVSTLGNAAQWAGTGAMIGSILPGVGTLLGAAIGGAAGLVDGIYDNYIDAPDPSNVASGKQYDEEGNIVEMTDQTKILSSIDNSTKTLADVAKKTREDKQQAIAEQKNETKYNGRMNGVNKAKNDLVSKQQSIASMVDGVNNRIANG